MVVFVVDMHSPCFVVGVWVVACRAPCGGLQFFVLDSDAEFFVSGFVFCLVFRLFVHVLYGEFDPGSGRTLAACLTHASRTERPRLRGTRVANG